MKQKKYGRGGGWWGESERHRLARLGLKTGSKLSPKRPFPPYLNPWQHAILEVKAPYGKYYGRRADRHTVIENLERQGWQVRKTKIPIVDVWEAWRGKNYITFTPTHWKKMAIEKAFIRDKDVGDRLKKIFRKPYPYRLDDQGRPKELEKLKTNYARKKKIIVYDNEGESVDRYTVIVGDKVYGMSGDPTKVRGFNLYIGRIGVDLPKSIDRSRIGKKLKKVPESVKRGLKVRGISFASQKKLKRKPSVSVAYKGIYSGLRGKRVNPLEEEFSLSPKSKKFYDKLGEGYKDYWK